MTEGSCFCGGVRFEVSKFATDIFKCHCSLCRKRFGGASSAAALVLENDFRLCSGSELIKHYQAPSGSGSVFCKECGSIVPIPIADKGMYWIPVGLLDGDPGVSLTSHVYVDSKAAWEILDQDTERLPEGFQF